MVYRGEVELTPQQMRAKCLEFEEPKVSAIAVGHFDGKDFATQLEKAIQSMLILPSRRCCDQGAGKSRSAAFVIRICFAK